MEGYQNGQGGYQNDPYGNQGGYQNNPGGYQNDPYGNQGGYQNNPGGYQNDPYGNQGGYQNNPGGYPNAPYGGYQNPGVGGFNGAPVNMAPMPNATVYLVLVIIGFFLGIIWGALSVGPYKRMKTAIQFGNVMVARAQAKKILIFFIIGVVVNVLIIIGQAAQSM
ncbi:MAG: hypothetical protein IJK02_06430 [Clostridia bacterium]|nr:hypothetical protein [Clostridia bacterium]